MPAGYSLDSLGWRVLDLEDDMANWGQRKYVLGKVDIFRIYEDYELFGAMNANYLKLDAIPEFKDGWQPVVDALRSGQFFVTTGEVLIPAGIRQSYLATANRSARSDLGQDRGLGYRQKRCIHPTGLDGPITVVTQPGQITSK